MAVFPLALRARLLKKGFDIIGEFRCRGFADYGFLKIFGGTNKGRPNGKDLQEAKDFARKLQEKI